MDRFINENFQHFNARVVKEAAKAWIDLDKQGGKMFVSLGGAVSTAGVGKLLAELIRLDKIAGISTTGANLEEDYVRSLGIGFRDELDYKSYGREEDTKILTEDRVRIADVSIPNSTFNEMCEQLLPHFIKAKEKLSPCDFFYQQLKQVGVYQPDSWLYAAMEKKLMILTPGFEDSSLGNHLVTSWYQNQLPNLNMIKTGFDQFRDFIDWYQKESEINPLGFFQVGGGISGDFPLCVVPSIELDLKRRVKKWAYFAQITDSTESYGGYSGASPNEKITWGKLDPKAPYFSIESDATIVAPLIFQYILDSSI